MDNTIAIITPSELVTQATQKIMKQTGREYPCFTAHAAAAVEKARDLYEKGLLVIISQGLTYHYLKKYVPVSVLELPFSGLDAFALAQQALAHEGKIIHIGTKPLHYQLQRALKILNEDPSRIPFFEVTLGMNISNEVNRLIDLGYNIFIGGHNTAEYVRAANKFALEYNMDTALIEATLVNAENMAHYIAEEKAHTNLNRAILESSSDGIIVLDEAQNITDINPAALQIFQYPASAIKGMPLKTALSNNNIVDINAYSDFPEYSPQMTPVFLRETPLYLQSQKVGSVVTIKMLSEIQTMDHNAQKMLAKKGLAAKHSFHSIVGTSHAIIQVKEQAKIYAKYDSSVLITGETGTGKELFAQSIHNSSKRKDAPFVAINCAAIPESLIESELFGYAKGAFTGANKEGKRGLFELADKGTLFLDEISEIPLATQSKLLRAIQEKEIIRVGGDEVVPVDLRIICSSNKNLYKLINEGKFKDDLYYRLSVLQIRIPPLRDRPEDIQILSDFLVRKYANRHLKNISAIAPQTIQLLSQLQLKGNVRELSNIIERMVILSQNESIIGVETLEQCLLYEHENIPIVNQTLNIRDAEAEMILSALEKCNGNKSAAARLLGISNVTLWRKLKKYELYN